MSKADRGFASMNRFRVAEIASMGGIAAHKSGRARTWNKETATEAAHKSVASRRAKKESKVASETRRS